ncbi:MAG: hypothetical protein K8R21_13595 [Leptospira sp.]|nr:hypothetical protein [Leptospira sp.]
MLFSNKAKCIWVLFLFFTFSPIFSMELVLKSGKSFICEVITEDEKKIKVLYKDKTYVVPRSDIQNIDYKKRGPHSSRFYTEFKMKDGSNIHGVIAEEDKTSFTLQTDIGFLTVEKSKIAKFDTDLEKKPEFPNEFAENTNLPETRIGFGGSVFANGQPVVKTNPISAGGFLYIEPAFLNFRSNWQFGFRSDYVVASGVGRFDFFNNFLYLQYNYKKSDLLNFYLNVGGGGSFVRYKSGTDNYSGMNPAAYLELGWQGLQWDRVYIRTGLRFVYINEQGLNYGMGGLEISFGVKI